MPAAEGRERSSRSFATAFSLFEVSCFVFIFFSLSAAAGCAGGFRFVWSVNSGESLLFGQVPIEPEDEAVGLINHGAIVFAEALQFTSLVFGYIWFMQYTISINPIPYFHAIEILF